MKNVIYINPITYNEELHIHEFNLLYVTTIYQFMKMRGHLPFMRFKFNINGQKVIIGKSNDTNFYSLRTQSSVPSGFISNTNA